MIAPAPSRLLPVPAPPHDPSSVLLDGRIGASPAVGWRVRGLRNVDLGVASGAIVLAPAPAASRRLAEPSGSFGGLRPPANVAVTAAGGVVLLDPTTGAVRVFDPCACRFVVVPCMARLEAPGDACSLATSAGRTAVPRDRLHDPRGIAACAGELFIADRGHHRVVRYALGTWVPRGLLRLPSQERARLGAAGWAPTGLAVDGRGRLLVTDPVNGRLDRFSPAGRWLDSRPVPGATHIAIDCLDRPWIVAEVTVLSSVSVASSAPLTLELDAGTDGFDWQTLQLSPLPAGARFAIDLHSGDEPWTVTHRDDPVNDEWRRWLDPDAAPSAASPEPLGSRIGRYLRIRLSPDGPLPAPFSVTACGARVVRLDAAGEQVIASARADLADAFGPTAVVVDRQGRLQLPCDDGIRAFGLDGEPATEDAARGDAFQREGEFRSTAIDSRIEACQWHRIELRGAIPPGDSVEVQVTTAELELSDEEVDELPPTAWTSIDPAREMAPVEKWSPQACAWDALITAPPGRYLWLRLVLRGGGRTSPCVTAALVEYPRISFLRYLPGVFSVDPAGADFTDRFTAIFDRTLRSIEGRLDRLALSFDPLSAPAETVPGHPDFLTWLGTWIGVTLGRDWPEERRRRYLKDAARLYSTRGTPDGLRRQLLLLLGFDRAYGEHCLAERPRCRCVPAPRNCGPGPACEPADPPPLVLEHFKLRRWLYAGHGRLGSDSELWGRSIIGRSELSGATSPPSGNARIGVTRLDTVPDPLHDPFRVYAHAFSVFVPARIRGDAAERRALERLLALEAPAHAKADIRYVEPRFRVGIQASIGLDTVVARMPSGVTLDSARLRQGTVLSGRAAGPQLEVDNARVGMTTRLT
jgi:phage tail-like protein